MSATPKANNEIPRPRHTTMTVVDGPDFLDATGASLSGAGYGWCEPTGRLDGAGQRGGPSGPASSSSVSRSPRLMHLTSVGTVAHVSAPRNKSDLADAAWSSVLAFFLARKEVLVEVAVEFELTPGDLQALMSLDPDEPKPMKVLAETFRCDPSNATWMVDRLEQRGIVERQSLPHDRRVRAVAVTTDGRLLRDSVMARLSTAPPEFAALSTTELDTLRCIVAKLTDAGSNERG